MPHRAPGGGATPTADRVFGAVSGLDRSSEDLSCGQSAVGDWSAQQQHFPHLTTGGRHNISHTQSNATTTMTPSIHPLTALLHYNDTHFPFSSPYGQPNTSSMGPKANTHFSTYPNRHGNNNGNRLQVKKPLNAFMLYMKEQRHSVLQEGGARESAAINQILGRRWHALSSAEQSKYYELAQKERQLHMQLYPGWSARDNYGKRKSRKREREHLQMSCESEDQ